MCRRPAIEHFTSNLSEFGMDEKTRKEVEYESALELFPRLKSCHR